MGLAQEHEEKYGISHFKQLFFLNEMLGNEEISRELYDKEIDRIQDEHRQDYEGVLAIHTRKMNNLELAEETGFDVEDIKQKFDFTMDEDQYYQEMVELASKSRDSPLLERPTAIPNDAEFSLGGGDVSN